MPVQSACYSVLRRLLRPLASAVSTLACVAALAADPTPVPQAAVPEASPPARPRIGLVLSGGGARGAAHIGVLKVLEEQRIPIHAIAGTSMGAIVGGLYASGMSAAECESLLQSVNWQSAFRDRPPRADLDSRRKQDDREFLVRLPLGVRGGRFQLPRGLVHGQKLLLTLRRATLPVAAIEQFDQLPIPFRAVATDIATGEPVILRQGQLASALRASMSAPGFFSPVELDGRLLVDGGIADNLPVEVARAMGVDVLIAVDVSFPLYPKDELRSALQISNQTLAILIGREAARQRALLEPADILIAPPLGAMGSTEFNKVQGAIRAGEQAARALAPRLAALSVSAADYAAFQARHAERTPSAARIEFVRVDEDSGRYRKLVAAAMGPVLGETLDSPVVDESLRTLYGKDLFETLDYRIVSQGERTGLEIAARRKSWGPNFVRFGLELQDNFEGDNSFNAGARFLVTDVNPYAAEWVTDLQLGGSPRFAMEFFQPLGYASPWFVAPRVRLESRNVLVPGDEGQRAEYRVREASYGIDFGRMFGNCCELRVGVQRTQGSSRLRIGAAGPADPVSDDFDFGQYFLRFSFDKLDSVFFPRHGELLAFEWNGTRETLGSARDNDRMEVNWLVARSLGRNTLIASLAGGTTLGRQPAVQDLFSLGGFLNLSGVTRDAITGPHYGIARLVYLRKIGSGGEGFLNVPMYAGLSFEAGNVWAERRDMSFGSARKDGAIFLGLDTLLGPVYLGAGFDEAGGSAYYLFLGRTF